MVVQLTVWQVLLVPVLLIASTALDEDIICDVDDEECVKHSASVEDDLGSTSLLQTKIDLIESFLTNRAQKRDAIIANATMMLAEDPVLAGKATSNFENGYRQWADSVFGKKKVQMTPGACSECMKHFDNLAGPVLKPMFCAWSNFGWKLPWPCHTCSSELHASCASISPFAKAFQNNPLYQIPGAKGRIPKKPHASGAYVPGTKGGPWTKEEVLAVKGKLWRLMSIGEGKILYDFLKPGNHLNADRELNRLAPKFINLGFHDCYKYKDGTGGCDGCLKWEGEGDRFDPAQEGKAFFNSGDSLSHNNGLMAAVQMLEQIWTRRDWPWKTTILPKSLKETGKSRADLWALAAIAGVEYTIMINNAVCHDPEYEFKHRGLEGMGFSSVPHCSHMQGKAECVIHLPRRLKFMYGRKDCGETFQATKEEMPPTVIATGKQTVAYFQHNFGFTGRETVAILGAHTVGRLHYQNSMLKFNWVKNGDQMWNNQYYRGFMSQDYRFIGNTCRKMGDKDGMPPPVRFVVKAANDEESGGPWQFIMEKRTCPDICIGANVSNGCCEGVAKCKDSCATWIAGSEPPWEKDLTVEQRLPAEMGFYYQFEIREKLPSGCAGFAQLTKANIQKSDPIRWSGTDGARGPHQCERQMLAVPASANTLADIVDEYAASQEAWMRDFVPTYEKLLANGYQSGAQLTVGPDQYTNVKCPEQDSRAYENRFWLCYDKKKLSTPFMIKSLLDHRAITEVAALDGKMEVWSPKSAGRPANLRQVWQSTESGGHFINAASGKALVVGGFATFSWSETHKSVLMNTKGKALDRGPNAGDGVEVTFDELGDGLGQKWEMVAIPASSVESVAR